MARQTRKKNIQRSKNTRRSNNGRKRKTRNLFRNKKNNKRRTKKFRGGTSQRQRALLAAALAIRGVQTPGAGNQMAMGINNPNLPLHHGTVYKSLKNTGTVSRNSTLPTAYNIPVRRGDKFGELMTQVHDHDHRVLNGNLPAPSARNSYWKSLLGLNKNPEQYRTNQAAPENNNTTNLNPKKQKYDPKKNHFADPGDMDHLTNEEVREYKELMAPRPRGMVGPRWTKKEGARFTKLADKIAKGIEQARPPAG